MKSLVIVLGIAILLQWGYLLLWPHETQKTPPTVITKEIVHEVTKEVPVEAPKNLGSIGVTGVSSPSYLTLSGNQLIPVNSSWTIAGTVGNSTSTAPFMVTNLVATSTTLASTFFSVGIGTTSPWGRLSLLGASGSATPLFSVATSTGDYTFQVAASGHLISSSTNPVLSSCGTAPTMVGDDTHGTVTTGTLATGCVVTFKIPYSNVPVCSITSQAATTTFAYSKTAAAITVTDVSLASDIWDYICWGVRGPN